MALKEFIKIDLETGKRLDVCLFDQETDEIPIDCKLGWDGNRSFQNAIWDFTLNDWIESVPFEELLLNEKNSRIIEFKNDCENAIYQPFISSNGHYYEFQMKDQMNFSQMFSLVVARPSITEVDWRTLDSGVVPHTRDEFLQVIEDAESHKRNNINKYWELKAAVEQSLTIEEVKGVVWL